MWLEKNKNLLESEFPKIATPYRNISKFYSSFAAKKSSIYFHLYN